VRFPLFSPRMIRSPWPVPRIDTPGDLAERFELDPGQLDWLADVRGLERHVARHTARPAVLRVDLEDFFASVTAARVYGIFRTAGYPEAVAHTLTGLCTNACRLDVPAPLSQRLAAPHLRRARRPRRRSPTSPRTLSTVGWPGSVPTTRPAQSRTRPEAARRVRDDRLVDSLTGA
jgi:hypothetical protein